MAALGRDGVPHEELTSVANDPRGDVEEARREERAANAPGAPIRKGELGAHAAIDSRRAVALTTTGSPPPAR
jgi:hypothetical protein